MLYVTLFCNYDSFNSTGFSSEEDAPVPKHRKRTYMNQPHLRFEITSDDGFSVKANSIEGKSCWFTVLVYILVVNVLSDRYVIVNM